ncbi:MAG: DUF4392 domain-containing protein [Oscillospiraceae bacterium]|jgi:hypothetical protein|nr:DUF4392 domain-containing protein [Oscillospiraceae bacterium]
MTQQELTELNLGQSLDDLANLDPRGYGVCKILYAAARERAGEPLTMHCARALHRSIKPNDFVYIITGFVLRPFKKAETDGIISAVLLARALVLAFGAKPVLVCQEENVQAAKAIAAVCGLHTYDSMDAIRALPIAMAVIPFTKDRAAAEAQADGLIAQALPAAVVSIEAPGANAVGEYHNATGLNMTELEAKLDVLFAKLQALGVLNIAIGDLGNEIGMGAIAGQLRQYIPYAGPGRCRCAATSDITGVVSDCSGGIAAATAADYLLTATVSDWGCYGMIAALAFLRENVEIMHDAELERAACEAAARAGMIDMYGWAIPSIDGFGLAINTSLVTLMRECAREALQLKSTCKTWFEKTLELGYFEGAANA